MANINRREDNPVFDLRREIDQLFESFFSPSRGTMQRPGGLDFNPHLEITETDGAYVLNAELPGLEENDVNIDVNGDVLTVRGEKRREQSGERRGYQYSERSYGQFARSLQLPRGTDASKIEAHFKNGVLKVTVPKGEAARARSIPIRTGGVETQQRVPTTQEPGNGSRNKPAQQESPPRR
ncbi:Hsp20/alpha crystallin family protein [Pendulispora brunnea]|uniref:Hsp20/alpha crystallin family protein n=1 Tax=Pendulispora brunnea TaxID=2905690 RepID=A0ABZ2KNH0_9BACT